MGHPPLTLHYQHLGEPMLETPTRDVLQTLLNRALQPIGVQLSPASTPRAWRLIAEVRLQPLKRWGDPNAPYTTGDLFASWRVQLQLRLKPPAGVSLLPLHSPDTPHEPLLLAGEAQAISHLSDMDAIQRALRQILANHTSPPWQHRRAVATTDVVLSDLDAAKLLAENARTKFLDKLQVVFVID